MTKVGSFLHSTTSGRWEDVIASALLPPPVGGGENPIWSKSVESRDGARTGRPAPPPRRTSPGRRPLPGTLIGPAPGGDPGPSPHPRLALLSSSSQQSQPLHGALVFLLLSPTAVPCPNLSPSARCRAPGDPPAEPRALLRSLLPQLAFAPLPQTSPALLSPCFPFSLLRRPFISRRSPSPTKSGDLRRCEEGG
ncbi:translation initiation factor IF-2-like [Meles meles]|uniref:translation initiation factor IF-2-like n=1 Tax=Meles meles TaxID=9662 RepID=UPI001E69CD94|nr:translation initiation factor IF-2-like [Meles meles]